VGLALLLRRMRKNRPNEAVAWPVQDQASRRGDEATGSTYSFAHTKEEAKWLVRRYVPPEEHTLDLFLHTIIADGRGQ
jgi:hypothetical protein